MSHTAILDTAEALRIRIGEAVGGVNSVHAGPPLRSEIGGEIRASLFLFHLQVNAELRNENHYEQPPALGPAETPVNLRDALPLDLMFLITVFRSPDPSASTPNELSTLGRIIQILQAEPTLPSSGIGGQTVRVSLEPYPMEEISRIWGLFPQDIYRTSMVYLASPVIVDAGTIGAGPPVTQREQKMGADENPPELFRRVEEGTT